MSKESRFRLEAGVILWLLALSFWAGFNLHQVEANASRIDHTQKTRIRIWDRLNSIDNRLSVIQGRLSTTERR